MATTKKAVKKAPAKKAVKKAPAKKAPAKKCCKTHFFNSFFHFFQLVFQLVQYAFVIFFFCKFNDFLSVKNCFLRFIKC